MNIKDQLRKMEDYIDRIDMVIELYRDEIPDYIYDELHWYQLIMHETATRFRTYIEEKAKDENTGSI